MAATLLGAIRDRFNAAVPGVAGGAWVDQAAEPIPDLPVVTFGYDGSREFMMENAYIDSGMVMFLMWDRGLILVETLAAKINDAFRTNWDQIAVNNAEVTSMIRTTYKVEAEDVRSQDGEQVYRAEMGWEVRVSGIDVSPDGPVE